MRKFKLIIVCLLLSVGMLLLPPLTGEGPGSLVTRAWFILGIIIYSGNYLQDVLEEEKKKAAARCFNRSTACLRPAFLRESSSK